MNRFAIIGVAILLSACSSDVDKIVSGYFDKKTISKGDAVEFRGEISDFYENKAAVKKGSKEGIVIEMPSIGQFELNKEYTFKNCIVSGENTYNGNKMVHVHSCAVSK